MTTAGTRETADHVELALQVGKAIRDNIRRTSRLYSIRTGERKYGVGGHQAATDAVVAVCAPLLSEIAALKGERDRWSELHRAVAELTGRDAETWPEHLNAPLAIAALFSLTQTRASQAESQRDEAVELLRRYRSDLPTEALEDLTDTFLARQGDHR